MLEWVGASGPRRRLCAGLVRGQQTSPEICWYPEACRPENKNATRRLEFSASRPLNFIVDCCNVAKHLKDIPVLVRLFGLAPLRTTYFAQYKCDRFYYDYYFCFARLCHPVTAGFLSLVPLKVIFALLCDSLNVVINGFQFWGVQRQLRRKEVHRWRNWTVLRARWTVALSYWKSQSSSAICLIVRRPSNTIHLRSLQDRQRKNSNFCRATLW